MKTRMASLEDRGKPGLPPPPAPTRRGANPWRFSGTARKAEPLPQAGIPRLLEDLMNAEPVGQGAPARPEPPARESDAPTQAGERSGSGLGPLIVIGIAVLISLRVLMDARDTGDWARMIVPLFAVLIIAHGWWRRRQRRRESRQTRLG